MNLKWPLWASVVITAAMGAVSFWLWLATPADFQFAVHFDAQFRPDRFAGKVEGLLVLPGLAAFLTGLFWLLPRIDPRAKNLAQSSALYITGWLGSMLILATVHLAILRYSLSSDPALLESLPFFLGLLLAAIGYFLGRSRSNFFAGIRTPWTLSSEYSWARTNRLGGILLMITGVTVMVFQLLSIPIDALYVLLGGVLATGLISIVASYFFWKSDPERR